MDEKEEQRRGGHGAVERRAKPQGLAEGEERYRQAREVDEKEPHGAELQHYPAALRLGRRRAEPGIPRLSCQGGRRLVGRPDAVAEKAGIGEHVDR